MKKLIPILALFASSAFAAGQNTGPIAWIDVDAVTGRITLEMVNANTTPACTTQPKRFTLDATTNGGKAAAGNLMTGFVAGRTVTIVGTSVCVSGVEGVQSIKVNP